MTYNELVKILLSNDVYLNIKCKETELLELIPELKQCYGFNQNNEWHIYDVYEHILVVIANVPNDVCVRLAALFHDIGKPLSYTEDDNGVGHFYNHWVNSLIIFHKYENFFGLTDEQIKLISSLIYWHDANINKLYEEELGVMIKEIGINNLDVLFKLKKADLLAQNPIYHNLLTSICEQEQLLLSRSKQ